MTAMEIPSLDTFIPAGDALVFLEGDGGRGLHLGEVSNVQVNTEASRSELMSGRTQTRTKADSAVTETSGTVSLTINSWHDFATRLAVLGDLDYLNQSGTSGNTVTFTGVEAGDFLKIGDVDISNVSLTDASSNTYTEGTHFEWYKAGYVYVKSLPGSSPAEITVTYDTADHTSDQVLATAIAQSPDIRGELHIVGNNLRGVSKLVKLWKVLFTPSGGMTLVSENREFTSLEVEGDLLQDPTKPSNPLGMVINQTWA